MKKKQAGTIKEIKAILEEQTVNSQIEILTECLSSIGTEKWRNAVNDLIKRTEDLNKREE